MKIRFILVTLIIATVFSLTGCAFPFAKKKTPTNPPVEMKEVILAPVVSDLSSVTHSQLEKAGEILLSRLGKADISGTSFYVNDDKTILLKLPAHKYTPEIEELLLTAGKVEFLDADGNVCLDSRGNIKRADAMYGQLYEGGENVHYVQITFTPRGRKAFAEATEKAVTAGAGKNYIAVAVDDAYQMAPTVNEVIDSDTCILTGNYTAEDAKMIAIIISYNHLPYEFVISDAQ